MKKTIKINDNINNKVLKKEIKISGRDHLIAQQRYKAYVFSDKTKVIPRKQKYKDKDVSS